MLNAPNVLPLLKEYRLVRFDITQSSAEQRALLDRYQLFGPPALLFFAANGSEKTEARVVGETNAGDFAHHLQRIRADLRL